MNYNLNLRTCSFDLKKAFDITLLKAEISILIMRTHETCDLIEIEKKEKGKKEIKDERR